MHQPHCGWRQSLPLQARGLLILSGSFVFPFSACFLLWHLSLQTTTSQSVLGCILVVPLLQVQTLALQERHSELGWLGFPVTPRSIKPHRKLILVNARTIPV